MSHPLSFRDGVAGVETALHREWRMHHEKFVDDHTPDSGGMKQWNPTMRP